MSTKDFSQDLSFKSVKKSSAALLENPIVLTGRGLGGARTTRGTAVPNIPMAMRTQVNPSILLN